MTDYDALSQRQREFEKDANSRFHDHGKHISRIEGIFEERTRALSEADHEQRAQIAAMGQRMDKVEERLTAKIEGVGNKVDELGKDVIKQGAKLAMYVTAGGTIGVVALNTVARQLFG